MKGVTGRAAGTAAVLVCVSLAVSGCGGGGAVVRKSPLAGPFSGRTVLAVDRLLTASGIVVTTGPGNGPVHVPSKAGSPLRVWAWQARNVAVQTADGGGLTGAQIDALAPVPARVLPLSYLLAAYVSTATTPGASQLRLLMGHQDWHHPATIVFPDLALALLASDVARSVPHADASPARPASSAPPLASLTASQGPCSTVSQWVNDTLDLLFGTIEKISTSLLPTFLADLVSTGLQLARGALGTLISVLSAPVVGAIKAGISLLALAFEAASILQPWSLRLAASPEPNSYSDRPGLVRLTVTDPGPVRWPAALQDCARQVTGRDLPQLTGAVNAPVAWTVEGRPDTSQQMPLIAQDGTIAVTQTSLATTTTQGRAADLDYRTSTEPPSCPGAELITSQYVIGAQVTRPDATTIAHLIPNLLGSVLARIPAFIRPVFTSGVQAITRKVSDKLRAITGHDSALTILAIDHHEPGTGTCQTQSTSTSPPPPPPPPVACDRLPSLAPPGGKVEQSTGRGSTGFAVLSCHYTGANGAPVGFIMIETFASPQAAAAFFHAEIHGELLPGFAQPVEVGESCPTDIGCNRNEFALDGSRIDEISQVSYPPVVKLPTLAQTNALMRRLLAIT